MYCTKHISHRKSLELKHFPMYKLFYVLSNFAFQFFSLRRSLILSWQLIVEWAIDQRTTWSKRLIEKVLSLDQNYSIKWPTKTFILEIESNLKKYIWPEVPLPQEIVRVRDKIPDLAVVRLVALMIMGFRSVSSYDHLTNIFDHVAKKKFFDQTKFDQTPSTPSTETYLPQ